MRPILFRLGGMNVRAYPAFLFLGLTFGAIAGTYWGIAAGLDSNRLYAGLILLIIPALAGSRLLFVATHWKFYRERPSEIFSPRSGGAALYGGLLLALAVSVPLLRILGLPFGVFWDAAAITLLVGMVFTKIGCLLTGCCAGRPSSSWIAVNLPNASGVWCPRVPSQLLEFALAVVLLIGALLWNDRPFGGAVFLTSVAIYATARMPLGATREKIDRMGSVNIYNVISVALLVASAAAIALLR